MCIPFAFGSIFLWLVPVCWTRILFGSFRHGNHKVPFRVMALGQTYSTQVTVKQQMPKRSYTEPIICLCKATVPDNQEWSSPILLWTLDISLLNIIGCRTETNNHKVKTLMRLWTHEGTPYLALTGELWDAFHELFGERRPRDIESMLSCHV